MKIINFKSLGRYINIQKIAALFFALLILTAYSLTFKNNSPIEFQKQKLINAVKNTQDKGISTLAITSLPFWFALGDRLTNEDE
jgi:hypothetical protein